MAKQWKFGIYNCLANVPWYVITLAFPYMTVFEVARNLRLKCLGMFGIAFFKTMLVLFTITNYMPALKDSKKVRKYLDEDEIVFIKRGILAVCILLFFTFLGIILKLRIRLRKRFDLEGNLCKDILASCSCCFMCTICQMRNQLFHEEQEMLVRNETFMSEVSQEVQNVEAQSLDLSTSKTHYV